MNTMSFVTIAFITLHARCLDVVVVDGRVLGLDVGFSVEPDAEFTKDEPIESIERGYCLMRAVCSYRKKCSILVRLLAF